MHYDSPGTYRITFTIPRTDLPRKPTYCYSGYAYLDEVKVTEIRVEKPFPASRVWGVKTQGGSVFWQSGAGGGGGQTVLDLSNYKLWVPDGAAIV